MEQWACLCSVHDITLFLLRCHCKHNGQATLNSTMEAKHRVMHAVYLHFKDKYRKKPECVTNYTYILLENQVSAAVSVSVSSNFDCKNYLSVGCSCYIFGSFETFLAIVEFEDRYSKKARVCH